MIFFHWKWKSTGTEQLIKGGIAAIINEWENINDIDSSNNEFLKIKIRGGERRGGREKDKENV